MPTTRDLQSLTAETAIAPATGTIRVSETGNTTTASGARGASVALREAGGIRQPAATEQAPRAAIPGATRVGAGAEAAMMTAVTHAVTEEWMETATAVRVGPARDPARLMAVVGESTATAETARIVMAETTAGPGMTTAAMPAGATPRLPSSPKMSAIDVPSLYSSLPRACVHESLKSSSRRLGV